MANATTTEQAAPAPSAAPKHPLMTVRTAALCLPEDARSESTVRYWIATGKLPSVKAGRHRMIRRRDLAAFLGLELEELTA